MLFHKVGKGKFFCQRSHLEGESVLHAAIDLLDKMSERLDRKLVVTLIGPSGAGKTTVTYLLPRLYDPTDGKICLDGHDLRDLTLDSLANAIGMVTQETYLFNDTLEANLRYAAPGASPSDLEAACQTANIHDFIAGLPDGYETVVGARGYRLSGGEKQRIAIARVILKNPRILVLDGAMGMTHMHLLASADALWAGWCEP